MDRSERLRWALWIVSEFEEIVALLVRWVSSLSQAYYPLKRMHPKQSKWNSRQNRPQNRHQKPSLMDIQLWIDPPTKVFIEVHPSFDLFQSKKNIASSVDKPRFEVRRDGGDESQILEICDPFSDHLPQVSIQLQKASQLPKKDCFLKIRIQQTQFLVKSGSSWFIISIPSAFFFHSQKWEQSQQNQQRAKSSNRSIP